MSLLLANQGASGALLAASVSCSATLAAPLSTGISLAAAPQCGATISVPLMTEIRLAGTVSGAISVTPQLSTAITLAAAISGAITVSSDLSAGGAQDFLASDVSCSISVTADLSASLMPSEIERIEDAVIAAIKAALDFRIVDTWPSHNLDELLKNTVALPACYVIYGGTKHAEKKVIGGTTADREQTFRLIVILQDLNIKRKSGQRRSYQYIEALVGNASSPGIIKQIVLNPILAKLFNSAMCNPLVYNCGDVGAAGALAGYLWPVDDGLIAVQDGKFVYGVEFVRKTVR